MVWGFTLRSRESYKLADQGLSRTSLSGMVRGFALKDTLQCPVSHSLCLPFPSAKEGGGGNLSPDLQECLLLKCLWRLSEGRKQEQNALQGLFLQLASVIDNFYSTLQIESAGHGLLASFLFKIHTKGSWGEKGTRRLKAKNIWIQ